MSTHETREGASDPALDETVSAEAAGVSSAQRDGGRLPPRAKLGRYAIIEFIGGGGMGWVYRAKDTELEREVAIKVVQPSVAGAKGRDRLLAEARAMAKLRHRAVVPVHDVGEYAGGVYVAMSLVTGGTLHDWMHTEARPWRQVVARFLEAGRGLAAAHAAGIVHRDFKPRNVLVGEGGEVMVADFGIASASVDAGDADSAVSGDHREATSVVGTPAYMAPEQAAGLTVDARADQYSFCVSLWEGLHGQRPQEAETRTQGALLSGAPGAPKSRRRVPGWLTDAVARGFAPAPERRWPTLAALLDALERGLRRRRRWVAAGSAAVVGATVVMLALLAQQRRAEATVPCAPPVSRVGAVWNAERAAQLRALFVALDPEYGAERATRLVAAFDALGGRWLEGSVAACRATRVEGRQSGDLLDRRVACLDQSLVAFGEGVRIAQAAPTRGAVDVAMRVIDGLPDLAMCADVESLREQPVLPVDPDARREYSALRAEFAAIDVARATGAIAGMVERTTTLVARARKLGDDLVLADALERLATALHDTAAHVEALKVREELVSVAAAAKDDTLAANSWAASVATAASALDDPDRAESMLLAASAAVVRAGSPVALQYELLASRAKIAGARRDREAALRFVEEGLRLLRAAGAADPGSALFSKLIAATQLRAMTLRGMRRTDEAISGFEQALELIRTKYGPEHPLMIPAYGNVAQAYFNKGDRATAIEKMTRAATIAESRMDATAMGAQVLAGLGNMLAGDRQFERARGYLERAVDLARKTMPPDDLRLAGMLGDLSSTLDGLGQTAEALAICKEHLAIYAGHGRPSLNWAMGFHNLGKVEGTLGHVSEALRAYEEATTMFTQVEGPTSKFVAGAMLGQVQELGRAGQWTRSLALVDAMFARGFGEDAAYTLAQARFWRGATLYEAGRLRSALAEVKAARQRLVELVGADAPFVKQVDEWLADPGRAPITRAAPQ